MATALRRERNGRRQRLSRSEDLLVSLTASQPHRRGETTNVAATGWQRALKAGLVGDQRRDGFTAGELELAGRSFDEARLCYLRAIEAPIPFANDSDGHGGDLAPGLRKRWLKDWAGIVQALGSRLKWILSAVEAGPGIDERLWPSDYRNAVSEALCAAARHFRVRAGA